MLKVKPQNVPLALTQLRQWIVWREKIPYQVDGSPAKTNDPSTWTTFDEAVNAYESSDKFDGIGFVFADSDQYAGIDLDGCRDPISGNVADWARNIIFALSSYAEISPSGTGVKIWVEASLPWSGKKTPLVNENTITTKQPAIELYHTTRYFAVTGWVLAGMRTIANSQLAVDSLIASHFAPKLPPPPVNRRPLESDILSRARKYVAEIPPAISGQGGHNQTFHVACVLVLGFGLTPDDAYRVLLEFNERCEPPWTHRDLYRKALEADKQQGERNYLRDAIPETWKSITVPKYTCPQPPAATTREPRIQTLFGAALDYLGQIKDGRGGLIQLGIPDLDHAIGGGVQCGEYIVVGARPSHGKTMLALQVAHHLTAIGLPCVFISEDMPNLAIGKRANQFAIDMPEEYWHHEMKMAEEQVSLHFRERSETLLVEGCGTAEKAADKIRWAHREHGAAFAIVDYVQKLTAPGKSRYEQITNASMMLRQVAIELNIPVIMLAQISRSIEGRPKFIPTMSDLKETGQIEQDADVILFLVWPHRLNDAKPQEEYQIFVAKNRNRQIKKAALKVRFLPARQMLLPERLQEKENYEPAFEKWNDQF